ncbi:hypothetical protein BN871_AC_01190 [Paenibacillus sp. P22]|nr:hypothetical protein BN871_AC_01190 [Paenibacillus sp. P22]
MKILHVIANLAPRYGGPAKAGLEMAAVLAAKGHEVTIFTTNQDGDGVLDVPVDTPIVKNGVTIRYFPVIQPKFWRTSPAMALALNKEIPKFDIVHIHSLYLFHGMAAGHFARKHGVPYIVRPHGTLDPVMYARHRGRKRIMETLFENRNIRLADALHARRSVHLDRLRHGDAVDCSGPSRYSAHQRIAAGAAPGSGQSRSQKQKPGWPPGFCFCCLFAFVLFLGDLLVDSRHALPLRIVLDADEEGFLFLFLDAEDDAVLLRIVAVEKHGIRLVLGFERIYHHHLAVVALFIRHEKDMLFMVMVLAAAAVVVMLMLAHRYPSQFCLP